MTSSPGSTEWRPHCRTGAGPPVTAGRQVRGRLLSAGARSPRQVHMPARRARSTGPAALRVRYFCAEVAFLAGAAVSGAVTWNTSSANFRWLASSCSAKL